MSRLIVKNLPERITEAKVQDIFGKHGELTNVQFKFTPEGKFRKFAFIGYKTKDCADAAIQHLNNTFIDGSKLQVEVCAKLGDERKVKPWSKYTKAKLVVQKKRSFDEEANENTSRKKKKVSPDDPEYAEYQEFLSLHKKKSERQKWGDQAVVAEDEAEGEEGEEEEVDSGVEASDMDFLKSKKVSKDAQDADVNKEDPEEGLEEDSEEKAGRKSKKYGVLPAVKIRGFPAKYKKSDLKQFFHPLKPVNIRMPKKVKGIAFVTLKTDGDLQKALQKHRSFIGEKRIQVYRHISEEALKEKDVKYEHYKKAEQKLLSEEEPVGESGRIFIRNLPYSTTEEEIEEFFKPYGELTEVNIPINKVERRNMGIAFVTFMFPEHAAKAFEELDGEIFQGRVLHLLPAKPGRKKEDEAGENSTYKDKKTRELKMNAIGAQHSWNSLFLGANAVVDVVAQRYGVSKKDVLDDGKSSSAAVRTALGETQLVAETRKFLVANGVSLDAFSRPPKKRSKRIVIVKNLPANTKPGEIEERFAKFGKVERVILPPSGVTAIVVMDSPTEARSAFKNLAYASFKRSPLYLEWAPEDVFAEAKEATKEEPAGLKEEEDVKDEEAPELETTIFVKGLNFDTTDDSLRQHFKKCGPIHSAKVSRKPDPKVKGATLSMGYGFVQFKKRASAQRALKELQKSRLDEHVLELKLSHRTANATDAPAARKSTDIGKMTVPKIMVRNIPFQANRKEIQDLFEAFGELQAVRLPKKPGPTNEHRGFGFVTFNTEEAAKRAFETMCHSTHLYGRRLVLEWAKGEDTVEEIREKTAHHFVGSEKNVSKNRKKKFENVLDEGEDDE